MRQAVARDRVREFLRRFALEPVLQVEVALLPGAGHGLVGGVDHALEPVCVVQRLERHHGLDGGAVRVGDDALFAVAGNGVRVDLRHHERHVGIHAPAARIVDHHRAGSRHDGGKVLGGASTRGEQRNVHVQVFKRGVGQLADGIRLAHERDLCPGAALGGKEKILGNRELALFQHLQKLSADHTRCAHNGNSILFHSLLHYNLLYTTPR